MNFNFDLSANLNYNCSNSYFSNFNISPQQQEKIEELFFSDDEENDPKPRLPLFGRCPTTGRGILETTPPSRRLGLKSPSKSVFSIPYSPSRSGPYYSPYSSNYSSPYSPSKAREQMMSSREQGLVSLDLLGSRLPLLQISSNLANSLEGRGFSPKKTTWSQVARKPQGEPETNRTPPGFNSPIHLNHSRNVSTNLFPVSPEQDRESKKRAAALAKPSLDEVRDDSVVALTNKQGKGKYWFKSGCPTPDPRWPARQQLMIGPIPGDVEYATLRSAFLSKGHTIHLFIQNNQAWLEKNQEKFGKKQVKFGYVVYTEPDVAKRLLTMAHVMVGHARVAVKEMDGQPALFTN